VAVCPRGHESDDAEWCDVCGSSLRPAPPVAAPVTVARCPVCEAPLSGRFCEQCGHDSTAPVPVAEEPSPESAEPVTWHAVVRPDPAWFEVVRRQHGADVATLQFPRYAPERRYALSGERLTIGRRSRTRGTSPDIDLTDLDPGVSAAHALLVARADGGWDVVDLGSTNGTTLDGTCGPIPPHVPVALADGAVVRLGAWTTITVATS
jgi:hypothetical protein